MKRPHLGRPAVAVASGLLLDVAFPPHDWWWLAPLAVALLTLAVKGQSLRRGALLGLLHGLGFFVPLLVWTGTIAGTLPWLALSLLEAGFLALLGLVLAALSRLRAWPVWSACAWVGEEALRDRLPFGGFPWGRLAFSQGDTVLTPLAALGGAPLVTLAVAALGAALASRPGRSWALPVALLALGVVVPTPTGGQTVRVAVVQGNVPRLGLPLLEQRSAVLRNHAEATRELAREVRAGRVPAPDLVVWPRTPATSTRTRRRAPAR